MPSRQDAPAETPFFLRGPAGRLFAFAHDPAGCGDGAFLFCHPFAEEKKNSHRVFVDLARALARRGAAALRFDYMGCGDSEGDFAEATISTRLADIACALAHLRSAWPDRVPGLIGLRLGGALAAMASERAPDVERLVLIEPVVKGREWFAADLRRVLVQQMLTDGRSSSDRRAIIADLERGEGAFDFEGWSVSGALYRELAALDLFAVRPGARRVLVVGIGPRPALPPGLARLAEHWRDGGAEVAVRAIVMPPVWNRLDVVDASPLVETVCAWALGG